MWNCNTKFYMMTVLAIVLFLIFACCHQTTAANSSLVRTVTFHHAALYPEKFVWDESRQQFIAGSIWLGALFTISDNGTVAEFIRDAEYAGMSSIIGLTIDKRRNRILAVVNDHAKGFTKGFHGVAAYDLETKARLFLAPLDQKASPNDIAVDAAGNIYVTDVVNNVILKVTPNGYGASIFADSEIFTSFPSASDDPVVQRSGLNGIDVYDTSVYGFGKHRYLIVAQSNSGKLFRISLIDSEVRVVDMDVLLVAADGICFRKDGLLVVVSTSTVWLVKSRDHWQSAYILDQLPLDTTLNATTVALRGPNDDAFVINAHFADIFTLGEKTDELRSDFSFHEIKLPADPDNDPIWLLVIVVAVILVFGGYQLQMNLFMKKYSQRMKRE